MTPDESVDLSERVSSWLASMRARLSRERLSAVTWAILGLLTTGLIGLAFWALALGWLSFGYSLVFGAPLVLGMLCGYFGHKVGGFGVLIVLGLGLGLVVSTTFLEIAGLYCALVLLAISFVPMVVGMVAGMWMRRRAEDFRPTARALVPLVLVVLPVPGLWWEGHGGPPAGVVEVVRTSRVVALTPEQAWERIVFYEEVPRRPPALARIGLPRPLYTEGEADGVGAVKRCVYTSGHLLKRITVHEPPRLLAFEVLEQHQVEDRSVDLVDGGFTIEALPDGRSRITLETRYRPLLQARLFWRPFEEATAHVLHEHVLDGIALGEGDTGPAEAQ